MRLDTIQISDVIVQDRARVSVQHIHELAHSIESRGLIHPIAVMDLNNGKYLLIAGGRRIAACTYLRWTDIPAHIYDNGLSDLELKAIELEENIQREGLLWQEEIRLKKQIHDLKVAIHGEKVSTSINAPGWSMSDTAELLGESKATISRDIMLAEAIDVLPELSELPNKSTAASRLDQLQRSATAAKNLSAIKAIDEKSLGSNPSYDAQLQLKRRKLLESYVVGDALEYMKKLPENFFHLVECDPPYGIDLADNRKNKDFNMEHSAYGTSYNEIPRTEYRDFMWKCLSEIYRVMNEFGWLILWHGQTHAHMMAQLLDEVGFSFCDVPAIWMKPSGQTLAPRFNLASSYETFYYARKANSDACVVQMGRSNIYPYNTIYPGSKIHPTERPIEMIQEVMSTFARAGSNVLVPFAGSGNTLLACHNLNMTGVGYDLTVEYKNLFAMRVLNHSFTSPFTSNVKPANVGIELEVMPNDAAEPTQPIQ